MHIAQRRELLSGGHDRDGSYGIDSTPHSVGQMRNDVPRIHSNGRVELPKTRLILNDRANTESWISL